MKLVRAFASVVFLLRSPNAGAQSTDRDSLSPLLLLSPAARYAEICPGPRDPDTGALVGRVRDVDDGSVLANATVIAEWLDVNLTAGRASARHASASAKTSGSGFYLLCGVPAGVRLNLRSDRAGYAGSPAQLALDDRLIGDLNFSLHRIDRAANDTTTSAHDQAQTLSKVDVKTGAVLSSWMVRSGFEERRKQAMGAFITEEEIHRHVYSELISVLQGARGIRVEYVPAPGGSRESMPYLMGQASIQAKTGGRCIPNYFLDGAPFRVESVADYTELTNSVRPEAIKGIEVYSNVGTIPAQYDLTSTTSCGSIVIWTH